MGTPGKAVRRTGRTWVVRSGRPTGCAFGEVRDAPKPNERDHLRGNGSTPEEAGPATGDHPLDVKRVHQAGDLDGLGSVELTQLGLDLSPDLCMQNAERIVTAAAERRTLVMIDMEGHEYVDATLRVHRELRERFFNVGVCLQAYLRRTAKDLFELPEPSTIRLCKGAYLEPED